ncbi:hypothetical protein V1508DRAFT_446110 [Lipomyces doorenjongii]|uniref:uncharacterized protein n=1 Tax=Lipomyces doorenjongii TaxID=383834 RepID=UPI0034CE9E21
MIVRMSYTFRAIFILLAFVWSTSAEFICPATLCFFKGHLKYSPTETLYWLEEKGSQCDMPFYTMNELGFSNFKSIKLALNDESKGDALLYLYHNRQAEDENVAFVNFEKTAYHFSGSDELEDEKFRVVGGEKVVVDFGSCVKGEYHWEFQVARTEGTIGGYVQRDYF